MIVPYETPDAAALEIPAGPAARSVWGTTATPYSFATEAEAPDYSPYSDEDETTSNDDTPAAAGFPLTVDEGIEPYDLPESPDAMRSYFEPLEGISDIFTTAIDFWKSKYNQAVAKLQAIVGDFLRNKDRLMTMQDTADRLAANVARRSDVTEDQRAQIDQLRDDIAARLEAQHSLEGKVQETIAKIRSTNADAPAEQLGIIPFVVGAAAIAAIVTVTGAVIIHNNSVNELDKQLDLAARGVLTPAQIAQIKNAGGLGSIASGFSSLALLGVAGLGAYFLFKSGRSRPAANPRRRRSRRRGRRH